ncbi:MAG: class I SAM-dependent methyltransferase [Aestuariibacter sp.]
MEKVTKDTLYGKNKNILSFIPVSNKGQYNDVERYKNFLEWLFETFDANQEEFRRSILHPLKLSSNNKVLFVGCGTGEEIRTCLEMHSCVEVHAQDISHSMVDYSAASTAMDSVLFTVSDVHDLPYQSNYFDAVFHFGGINQFSDIKVALQEMTRVCKVGGRIVVGDEGVAEHLKSHEFGKIAINNIPIWSASPPMEMLPENAESIELKYILSNCFYLLSYDVGESIPFMNIDVPHKGIRGGSARTRYYGKVEGIDPKLRASLYKIAEEKKVSVEKILSEMVRKQLDFD